jgi:HAE1 family hydrophobic/amphiphilic exporter-1
MFSRFFIERPIFAGVISIVIIIAGGVSIPFLPVEQTPNITPPTVSVTTNYPGANAEVIAETVAQPIEEEVNGVEDMLYMFSKCGNDGSYELTVTFAVGTDIDMATVLVQNRVAIAMPKLPEEVTREGVKTEKQSTAIVLMVNLVSEKSQVPVVSITADFPDKDDSEIYGSIVRPIYDRLDAFARSGLEENAEQGDETKVIVSKSWAVNNGKLDLTVTFAPEVEVEKAVSIVQQQVDAVKEAQASTLAINVQKSDDDPPTILVTGVYPHQSEQEVLATIVRPILDSAKGIAKPESMKWKFKEGNLEITIPLAADADAAEAQQALRKKIDAAKNELASSAFAQKLVVSGAKADQYLFDELYLSNYVGTKIKDVLGRVDGVGKVNVMGAKDFGMRIWLDPNKLKARNITTTDVLKAIREQNVQVAAGQIGAPPAPKGQEFEYTVKTLGRLSEVSQFEDMVLKVGAQGRTLRLRDVARVEMGAQSYKWSVQLNGNPSIAVAIYQRPGANSLSIYNGIKAEMERLKQDFPPGLDYRVAYNTTDFVKASIAEVWETLFIAVLLVIATVYVFLQDWRTTLIPAMTIPVSLIGTFGVMLGLGFSINTLSLFGIVLAIGIVVDDAIVVVENTMRLIDDEGLSPKEAAKKAMIEVSGPVVATTAVLLAVFVPTAMMGGITGRLYREFSITIATATVFSSINALTLSPALCGVLLRPSSESRFPPFVWFNKMFDVSTRGYLGIVRTFVRRGFITILGYGALVAAMVWSFGAIPGGFLPNEDQGYIMVNTTLPDGASLERTGKVIEKIDKLLANTAGVADVISVTGYSALDAVVQPNSGTCFVVFDNWSERPGHELSYIGIIEKITPQLNAIREANTIAFPPPPITGLGNAGGFDFRLQDTGGGSLNQLEDIAEDIVNIGNTQSPVITRLNNNFRANVPQIYLDVDRVQAKKMDVPLENIFGTLQAYLGSAYVNDFNKFGKVYKVMIQADSQYRARVKDINRLYVRSSTGKMVPIQSLITISDTVGPQNIFRYNMFRAATITGSPAPGYASGQAIEAMEKIADENKPSTMKYEWSGITYQQLAAAGQAVVIFSLAIIFVYLFLAAQYESWSIPLAVMFAVPLAILGGMLATLARSYDNNVYTQIGVVLLIGLASKTAILIVEFAKQKHEEGLSIIDAAVEASRLRFRAILMTAFSFILGVVPLVVASGAGSASRRALGTAVFGGMSAATVLGVFFIPLLYVVVQSISERLGGPRQEEPVTINPIDDDPSLDV